MPELSNEQMREAARIYGSIGGEKTRKIHGRQHYKDMANKRWAKKDVDKSLDKSNP